MNLRQRKAGIAMTFGNLHISVDQLKRAMQTIVEEDGPVVTFTFVGELRSVGYDFNTTDPKEKEMVDQCMKALAEELSSIVGSEQ
jgi:hypothetical protein